MEPSKRNANYDLIRFIGISCIILAHMEPPIVLFQLRNFDVPLMVLLSGISFSQFSIYSYSSYLGYLYSRFLRLVLPTWLFLVFYNFSMLIAGKDLPDFQSIVQQVTLVGGTSIGIWIIRIFVSIAIIAPFLYRINNRIKTNKTFYYIIALTYVLYEVSYFIASFTLKGNVLLLANIVIFYTISYGMIFLYGLRISSFNPRELRSHLFVYFVVFLINLTICFIVCGNFLPTQSFKYPPTLYYLSYSILSSVLIYYTVITYNSRLQHSKIIQFIGQSTLWLYLWHWFLVGAYNYLSLNDHFLIKFIAIYTATIVVVYTQTRIILLIKDTFPISRKQGDFILKVFTG